MSSSAADPLRPPPRGFSLVELVLVIALSAVLFAVTPPLLFHGVKTMVFLPKALAVNEAASELMQQLVDGGFSTLPAQTAPVRGLRFAVGRGAGAPALWLAEAGRIGFLTSDGQYVVIRLDGTFVKRRLRSDATCPPPPPVPSEEETLPYDAQAITITGGLFTYYNQSGVGVAPPGCGSSAAIRRVDISFTATTGGGSFEQSDTRQAVATSVAIRVP